MRSPHHANQNAGSCITVMSRRSLSARIRPGIVLTEMRIKLPRDFGDLPQVELHGSIEGLSNKRAEAVSRAVIHTMYLTPEGERFIEQCKEVFGTNVAAAGVVKESR